MPLVIDNITAFISEYDVDILFAGSLYLELILSCYSLFNAEDEVFAGILYHSHLTVRHEILHKLFFLVRHEPCEVWLVLGIYTRHKLDIGPVDASLVLVGQGAVPCSSKVAVTPCPLFLAWGEMV